MLNGIVIYDSHTGNTQKIAEEIAKVNKFTLSNVVQAPADLRNYDLAVIGTPNIRAHPSAKICAYIAKITPPKYHAVFVTFGMPLWGQISSFLCLEEVNSALRQKGSHAVGNFMCPGYHVKYKTYKGKPSAKELLRAGKFAVHIAGLGR